MKNINIYDVAKAAGVSTATVSRVVNEIGNVRPKTKERVEEVIKQLGYTPNQIARGLATNSSKTIGILVPDIRNSFHAESAFELEQRLNQDGYSSILCNTTESVEKEIEYLHLLYGKKVDGIITVGAAYGEEAFIDALKKINREIPVVMINNKVEDIISVYCDEEYGMDKSIAFLKEKGYRYPIYVGDLNKFENRACISKKRGFMQAFSKYYPHKDVICLKSNSTPQNCEEILAFIQQNSYIDAIQFEKDTSAIFFMKHALSQGVDIPGELAVIGFDNINVTEFTQKKISTIDHKISEHCSLAVELMIKKLNKEEISFNHTILPEFISKETT